MIFKFLHVAYAENIENFHLLQSSILIRLSWSGPYLSFPASIPAHLSIYLKLLSPDERWVFPQPYTYTFAHSDLLLGILQFSSNSPAILFQLLPYLLGKFCFSQTIAKNYLFLEKFHCQSKWSAFLIQLTIHYSSYMFTCVFSLPDHSRIGAIFNSSLVPYWLTVSGHPEVMY